MARGAGRLSRRDFWGGVTFARVGREHTAGLDAGIAVVLGVAVSEDFLLPVMHDMRIRCRAR